MCYMTKLDPEYLEILRCPVSLKPLVQHGDWLVSTDPETRLRYPIRDGFPVMLQEESEELSLDDWKNAMDQPQQASDSGAAGG